MSSLNSRNFIDYAENDMGSEARESMYAEIHDRVLAHIEGMKKGIAQNLIAQESVVTERYDDDDEVSRADRELKRMGAKPIKAANIDTSKDKIVKTKKDKEAEMDEEVNLDEKAKWRNDKTKNPHH